MSKCEWKDCKADAVTVIINDRLNESKRLCKYHRNVAVINLEFHSSIAGPADDKSKSKQIHLTPGQKQQKRPEKDPVSWEKEAAKKAEERAVEIEPLQIDEAKTIFDKYRIIHNLKKK